MDWALGLHCAGLLVQQWWLLLGIVHDVGGCSDLVLLGMLRAVIVAVNYLQW